MEKLQKNVVNAVGSILSSCVNQPIMTKNESNLLPDEFAAKFGGETGTVGKGIFIERDNKTFRVVKCAVHVLPL